MKLLWLALAAQLPLATFAAEPAPFGQFLDLGGYRVHYYCEGATRQGPTVVLLHGTPRFSIHFALIQPRIAKFTRVCTYDRAGDAWSESVAGQPSAQQVVDELDAFLNRISPNHQVVLVGHSVGGVIARAYHSRYEGRVASMVLIDTVGLRADRPSDDELRSLLRGRAPQRQSDPTLDGPFARLPRALRDAHLWATRKWNSYADGVDPLLGLQYQADLNHMAAQARRRDMPVWIVGRAEPASWAEVQRKLAAFWPKAKLVRVRNTSHDIQLDQPDAVVAAVRAAALNPRGVEGNRR